MKYACVGDVGVYCVMCSKFARVFLRIPERVCVGCGACVGRWVLGVCIEGWDVRIAL